MYLQSLPHTLSLSLPLPLFSLLCRLENGTIVIVPEAHATHQWWLCTLILSFTPRSPSLFVLFSIISINFLAVYSSLFDFLHFSVLRLPREN